MVDTLLLTNINIPFRVIFTGNYTANADISEIYGTETGGFYGLVVTVPGYRSRGPGSIPDAIRFFAK
jgi:hypothetical protein